MKLTEKQQKLQEFLSSIYKKVWEDEKFKQELIANPIATLNVFTDKEASFPEDKKLVVEDQTNLNYIYLNIPKKPNLEDIELNEEQLEMVAGGTDWFDYVYEGNEWIKDKTGIDLIDFYLS